MEHAISIPADFPASALWADLLREWQRHLARYEREVSLACNGQRDIAYWYNERVLTGILGAAAWSIGGWSIEEFSTTRNRKDRPDANSHGRGDLWIGRGCEGLTVEAKVKWADESEGVVRGKILAALKEAGGQLTAISPNDRIGKLFSLCYVVPCYSGKDGQSQGVNLIEATRRWAQNQVADGKPMATASHLGEYGEHCVWNGKESYPGVLLVINAEPEPMADASRKEPRSWSEATFFGEYAKCNPPAVTEACRVIYDLMKPRATEVSFGTGAVYGNFMPNFSDSRGRHQVFNLSTNGRVGLSFGSMATPPFSDHELRRELVKRLKTVPGIELSSEEVTGWPSFPLDCVVDQEGTSKLAEVIDWAIRQVEESRPAKERK